MADIRLYMVKGYLTILIFYVSVCARLPVDRVVSFSLLFFPWCCFCHTCCSRYCNI